MDPLPMKLPTTYAQTLTLARRWLQASAAVAKHCSLLMRSESVCRDEAAKMRQPSHPETKMAARFKMLAATRLK